jgi:guanylate kinase
VIVLTAPSGGGKTTITKALLADRRDMGYSVSATTRKPRPGEADGIAYHFLSRDEFARRRAAGAFIEWAEYAGEWYATLKSEVEQVLASGRHVVIDVEIQGAQQVARRYPAPQSVGIFILPPSASAWERRLVGRGTESRAGLAKRLEQAVAEIKQSLDWKHIVINDDLPRAVAEISAIVDADGAVTHRPPEGRVNQLVNELVVEADRLRRES